MNEGQDNDARRWELVALYAGPADAAVAADLAQLRLEAVAFRRQFRGRLAAELSAALLCEALQAYERLQLRGLRPYAYAQLLFAADGTVEAHKALLAQVREAFSAAGEETLFFELAVAQLPAPQVEELLADPCLADFAHYLRQLRAHAPYTLAEEVEQVMRRKDLSGREGFAQLFDELTASWRYRFPFPGEAAPREVTGEELLALLHHPQAQIREQAFTLFLERHGENALVLTACFNNILLDHGREAELRRYPELMTPSHLASETDALMVEQMLAVTEANYPLARQFFELKRQLLGLERLKNTDLYAPLNLQTRSVSFAQAQEQVLAAFAGFSPELAEGAATLFAARRIDSHPRPGKSPGAFCHGMYPGCDPYILLNFSGTSRDVSTLAHEVGHGVHYLLAQRNHLFHYHATLPFAETASVFAEMLLARHLLALEQDPEVRIGLLCARLEEIVATTFRQSLLTRFELAAHQRRGERLLAPEDYCELWWQENHKLFGDSVAMIPAYRWGWSYISHFIHSRFYCYSYVFGELLTLALYQRYRAEGASFVAKFHELLCRGGSMDPAALLRPFAIDLRAPDFWQSGYDLIGGMIAELRQLVEARERERNGGARR
ncbi:MAG: hypothetical protein A2091_10885 [Desulfuromonadales bacterium GWD2_61_12]|nr:MAG: hypothetical protein A2005_08210 [Desulfuromonadales bacterium GWC2_61_20]OGR32039.1 MAG: hypothetical protein A2091_10885 [Desulfuromonadales bacterium GWD2_61_12]HBT83122.1 oligoendopeptidase F [Desulfuromonas sp.]